MTETIRSLKPVLEVREKALSGSASLLERVKDSLKELDLKDADEFNTFLTDDRVLEKIELDRCEFEFLNNRRSEMEIIALILKVAKESEIKTKIQYQANLSYSQLSKYLNFLCDAGFIRVDKKEGKGSLFTTTLKGKKFLYHWTSIVRIIVENRIG